MARMTLIALAAGAVLVGGAALAYRMIAPHPAPPEVALGTRTIAPIPEPIASAPPVLPHPADPANALGRQRDLQAFQDGIEAPIAAPGASADAPQPSSPTEPAPEAPPAPSAAPASIDGLRVVVYTTSWCPVCKRAKAWMTARGIPYEEHDIEASSENARQNRAINPRGSIPTFDVEGDVMIGFSEGDLVATMQRAAERRAARAY